MASRREQSSEGADSSPRQGMELLPLHRSASEQSETSSATHAATLEKSENEQGDVDDRSVYYARRLLYTSHFFAQFSEISFQFCLALFLAAVTQFKSLILVSTYGLCVGLAVATTGGRFGRYIDESTNRLRTGRWLILGENFAVIAATGFCFVLLSTAGSSNATTQDNVGLTMSTESQKYAWLIGRFESVPSDVVSVSCLIAIHILGACAQVLDRTFLVAIERDWVVVISQAAAAATIPVNEESQDTIFQQWLSETNVAMKQIDLCCKVAAPAVSGILVPLLATGGGEDFRWACILIGGANAVSLVVEYVCTARIYRLVPALATKGENTSICEPTLAADTSEESACASGNEISNYGGSWLPEGLHVYLKQSSAFGGLALALLYTNPLTFGNGIMSAYLLYRGMRLEPVGILRGFASVIGLLGTFAYRFSAKIMSLEATALWSVSYQCCCLAISLSSLAIGSDAVSLTLLVGGIIASRIGLWVYDIALTQIQQQEVPSSCRGQVGGTQQSLNAFFNLLSFGLGVVFPNPEDFPVYLLTGFVSVGLALLLFAFGVYIPRR